MARVEELDDLGLVVLCLLDGQLSVHEADALVGLESDLGLTREHRGRLHQEYFGRLASLAWADHVLDDAEWRQLRKVGDLLMIPAGTVERALTGDAPRHAAPIPQLSGSINLSAGDRVCLTGEMSRPREHWVAALRALGIEPWPGVTRKVAPGSGGGPRVGVGQGAQGAGPLDPRRG